MISETDRQKIKELIQEGTKRGLSVKKSCEAIGISDRTLRNWKLNGPLDGRTKGNGGRNNHRKLGQEEREAVIARLCMPDVADMSVNQAMFYLYDLGIYLCSTSTAYRIMRQAGLLGKRSPVRSPKRRYKPEEQIASKPNMVWTWDITYFRDSRYSGRYFYAYVVVDLYSRRIMNARVYEADNAGYASEFLEETFRMYNICPDELVLHSDNGASMRAKKTTGLLQQYGVKFSHSRPRVSNDNPYSESLFRTLKYNGFFRYPQGGFNSIEKAQNWLARFTEYYNKEHRHSGIKMVTPDDRYYGRDKEILRRRRQLIRACQRRHPERWISGKIMDCTPIGSVVLNPNMKDKNLISLRN